MKIKILLPLSLCFAVCANAQKPFKELGLDKEVDVLTLSNGRYVEYFTYDTLRQIGSVMFNTKTHRVEYFIPEDDLEKMKVAARAKETSRFLSIDPLAKNFPSLSPYQYASNSPIANTDLDGLESNLAIFSKGQDAVAFQIRSENLAKQVKSVHFSVHPVASGSELLTLFKSETKSAGSIGNFVINSHAFAGGLSISMGERKGFYSFKNSFLAQEAATIKDLKTAIDKKEIVFDPNAVAIFGGCSCGNKGQKGEAGFSEQFTSETGVASISSKGSFSPVFNKEGNPTGEYTSDEGFYKFEKQKDGTVKETFLGKKLNLADYLNKNNKVPAQTDTKKTETETESKGNK